MLLPLPIGVAEWPPVREGAVRSVSCACLLWSNFVCVLLCLLVLRVRCGMRLY